MQQQVAASINCCRIRGAPCPCSVVRRTTTSTTTTATGAGGCFCWHEGAIAFLALLILINRIPRFDMAAMMNLVSALFVVAALLSAANAAPRGWGYAHITFYGTPNGGGQASRGACGYQNTYALGYGAMTAALSSTLYKGGQACGACYQLKCVRIRETRSAKNWCWSYSRTITITATNLCPPGSTGGWCNPPKNHFDLSVPAYNVLARREGGVAPVYFRRVACRKRGGIRFTVGGNPWFLMILIHNVGGAGDVRSVKIKCPTTGWVPMYRNWGSLWTVRKLMKGPLSFAITTSNGRTVYSTNAVGKWWKFGQTWQGRGQF